MDLETESIRQKQKILIVDDEPGNIKVLLEALRGENYTFIVATNGQEAIECAVAEDSPDLILLDIMMPEIDGFEVCRRLKNEKKTADIPVIFITAIEEKTNEYQGFLLGAIDYITKPFNPSIVKARVQTHLELKHHRDYLEKTVRERTEKLRKSNERLRQEISERKRAEEQLAAAITHSPIATVVVLKNGKIITFNTMTEDLTGYSSKEMGTSADLVNHLFPDVEYRKTVYDDLDEILMGTKWIATKHYRIRRKDGQTRTVQFHISSFEDGYVIQILDITREVRLENQLRQAQKMEAVGTLAGGIAHDFNNILGALLGYADMAFEICEKDSRISRYINQVLIAGRRARDLVKQILAFSRQDEEEKVPLQISVIIKEVLNLLRSTLPATIEIRQELGDMSSMVIASPTQIHQVVMNLCANAAHAMRENGGILMVKMVTTEIRSEGLDHLPPGAYVEIIISDTGHGIDQAIIERIFEPFFTTKSIGEGTGMGLSVVHGTIKSIGGEIFVESERNRGTTFRIFLPKVETDVSVEPEIESSPFGGTERVLFVDDEINLANLAEDMLESLGYDVVATTSSAEALNMFRSAPDAFDLVITDQTMPHMTGAQLAIQMLEIRTDIPIILCTGFSESITPEKAKDLGIRDFLMKPLAKSDIANTIRSVLES